MGQQSLPIIQQLPAVPPMRPQIRYNAIFSSVLVMLAACSAESPDPATSAAEPNDGLDPVVIAAIDSAARGTPFTDDLHPGTAQTGKPLSPVQQAFDVRHYTLDLRVMPESLSIDGSLSVLSLIHISEPTRLC